MDIKSCEQYVLTRLEKVENELEERDNELDALRNKLVSREHLLDTIRDCISTRLSSDGQHVILELSVWDSFDTAAFDKLVSGLGLDVPTPIVPEDAENAENAEKSTYLEED